MNHARLSGFSLIALCCGPVSVLAQSGARNDVAEPETTRPLVEIQVLVAEWKTAPPEAGRETLNELSGDSHAVAERVAALRKANRLAVLERFRLMALDGAQARSSSNEAVPITDGVAMSPQGVIRLAVPRNVGTFLRVRPKVAQPDAIQLGFEFEQSKLADAPDAIWVASDQGQRIAATKMTTFLVVTALRIRSGQTAAVAGHSNDGRHLLLLVTASVVP